MATYLLTWNPKRWPWKDLQACADEVAARGGVMRRWSCGNTRRIASGDRIFLLRQGQEPRGIIGSGVAITSPFPAPSWDSGKQTPTWYINVEFDALHDPEVDPILPRARLDDPPFAEMFWDTQASGTTIPLHVAGALEQEWAALLGNSGDGPPGVHEHPALYEGTPRAVTLNVYERNPEARRRCLAHYGVACFVCGFDFRQVYGPAAEGYIHVHHLKPIAELGERYEIDPIASLRPVCPNCHAVIHCTTPPYTPEEVRAMLQ